MVLGLLAADLGANERRDLASRVEPSRTERELIVEGAKSARRLASRFSRKPRPTPSTIRSLCDRQPVEVVLMAYSWTARADARRAATDYLTDLRSVRLSITGRDLLRAGVSEGPAIAGGLRAALRAKLDGRATGRLEELRAAVRAARRA
jgi:tRNA nucleotidyltransferase (CCA-adding enzyme)